MPDPIELKKFSTIPITYILNYSISCHIIKLLYNIFIFIYLNKKLFYGYCEMNVILKNKIKENYNDITCIKYSNTGDSILSSDWYGVIIHWSIKNKKIINQYQCDKYNEITKKDGILTIKQYNDKLFFCTWTGSVVYWDMKNNEIIKKWTGYKNIISIDISSDGQFLLISNIIGLLEIWEIKTLKLIYTNESFFTEGNIYWIEQCSFHPTKNHIIFICGKGGFEIWDLKEKQIIDYYESEYDFNTFIITKNSNDIIIAGDNGIIYIIDIKTLTIKHELIDHSKKINTIKLTNDKKFIISGGDDGYLRIWNKRSKKLIFRSIEYHDNINSIDTNPIKSNEFVINDNNVIKLYNITD